MNKSKWKTKVLKKNGNFKVCLIPLMNLKLFIGGEV